MKDRRKIFIIATLLLFVVIIGVILLNTDNKEERKFYKITNNIQNYELKGDKLYFFTKSFFASYNIEKNTIERLSDYLYLQNDITDVDFGKGDKVIFRALSSPGSGDDLDTINNKVRVENDTEIWWMYDFKSKSYISLNIDGLEGCEYLKQINGSGLVCFKEKVVTFYDINKKSKSSLKLDGVDLVTNVVVTDKSILFSGISGNKNTLHKIDTATNKVTNIYSTEASIGSFVSQDSNNILVNEFTPEVSGGEDGGDIHQELDEDIDQKLVLIKNQNVLKIKDFKTLMGSVYVDTQGDLSYFSLDGSIKKAVNGDVKDIIKPSKDPDITSKLFFDHKNTVYLIDYNNNLTSSDEKNISEKRKPTSFNPEIDNDNSGNSSFWIEKEPLDTTTVVFLYSNTPFLEQAEFVDVFLNSKNFQPSEFNFSWKLPIESDIVFPKYTSIVF